MESVLNRRLFLQLLSASLVVGASKKVFASPAEQPELSVTLDDPNLNETPLYTSAERNTRILETLRVRGLVAALYVCGKRIDKPGGKELIQDWDTAGHLICNHSYSHLYYHSPRCDFATFSDDFSRGETLIKDYKHYTKFFRFPYLKEGDTKEKRDAMRAFLKDRGYRNGYVTVDTSDWYVNDRLSAALKTNSKCELKPYRDFYINHVLSRSAYYNDLSLKVVGRPIKHTILLHHTLANALFLGDVLDAFVAHGWKLIGADEAYKDPVFLQQPDVLPAGESLVWSLAKQTGKYDSLLRYPGEDDSYEKAEMDRLGL